MTRLGRSLPAKQVDLAQAFRFLGVDPSYRELGLVVDWLRESGVEDLDYDDELVELAEAKGSRWHDALDLVSALAYGVEVLWAGPRKARSMKPLKE